MLRPIHRWLGLALCLSVFIMSLTGVLLLWKKEFLWLSFEQARYHQIRDHAALANLIDNIINQYEPEEVLSIRLHAENLSIHKVFLSERRYAWHGNDGNQIQVWQGNQRFEDFLLDLHHRFLLGNTIGLNIAGFSGLLLIPLMFLGLYLWWPRRKNWRSGLVPKALSRPLLIRSHSNLGTISLLPVVVISITGVILVYPNESRQLLLKPFISVEKVQVQTDDYSGGDHATWQRILERTSQTYPLSTIRWVSPATDNLPAITVGVQQAGAWNNTGQSMLSINPSSGVMDGNSNALLQPKLQRTYNFSYPLHTGKLGLWYRLLLSLIGCMLCAITLFGFTSFVKRRAH